MSENAEQIEFWNGQAGSTWVTAQTQMDTMLAPLSAAAIERAAPQPGERAIDVGCGCGATTLALAERGAAVWGVDVSAPMLALAKSRAEGLEGVAFSQADAASQAYTPDHQLVFSRFGVMFFADPVAAFRNIRTALAPEGRMTFICWQKPSANPWMSVGGAAIAPYLPEPEVPVDPRAPGPFAFADQDYLHGILDDAGFGEIEIEDLRRTIHLADTLDEAMYFQGQVGPVARALSELEGTTREAALQAAREALAGHMSDDGLKLGAATWLVSARQS